MPAPKFRGDYTQLNQIAQTFAREANDTRQFTQRLKRQMQTLQGGDWVGKGATAFYQEMNSQVLPALNRLGKALENASRVTSQISRLTKAAEDDAARVFRLDETGGAASVVAGVVAGMAAGLVGGAAGAVAGTVAGMMAAGAASGVATGMAAGGAGAGAASGVSGAGGATTTPPTTGNEAADRMLAGLDPQVTAIAGQSPTLVSQLETLENQGWSITTGPAGDARTFADRTTKTIVMAPGQTPESLAANIAHEAGHAEYGKPPYHAPTATMTRQEYIDANVRETMLDEGHAQLSAATARDEISTNGGPDIGIPGTQTADYQRVYDDYEAGTISRDDAIGQMADLMGNERASGNPPVPYHQYYGKTYADYWDAHIAPTRGGP